MEKKGDAVLEFKQLRKQNSGKLHYFLNFHASQLAQMESWVRN